VWRGGPEIKGARKQQTDMKKKGGVKIFEEDNALLNFRWAGGGGGFITANV